MKRNRGKEKKKNRMGKTRDFFKKIRDTKEMFQYASLKCKKFISKHSHDSIHTVLTNS